MEQKNYAISQSQKDLITDALLEAQAKISFNALIVIGQLPEIKINQPDEEGETKA